MKKFLLVGNGIYRAGSTSLWRFLKLHPEISVTIPKEYTWINRLNYRNYISKAYNLLPDQNVLFDGAPGLFVEPNKFNRVIESHKKIKAVSKSVFIYIYRKDSFKRTMSMFNQNVKRYLRGRIPLPPYLNSDNTIKESTISSKWIFFDDLKMLNQIEEGVGIDNMFVVRLEEIEDKQNQLYDFMGVSNINNKFPRVNATDDLPSSIPQLLIKKKIIDRFLNRKNEIDDLIEKNEQLINERYLR
jgi:hypothetical protein